MPLIGGQFEYSPSGVHTTPQGRHRWEKSLNKQYSTQVLWSSKLSEYSVPL